MIESSETRRWANHLWRALRLDPGIYREFGGDSRTLVPAFVMFAAAAMLRVCVEAPQEGILLAWLLPVVLVVMLAVWVLQAWLLELVGHVLARGTESPPTLGVLMRALGLASVPGFFAILGFLPRPFAMILSSVVSCWIFCAQVMAVRESFRPIGIRRSLMIVVTAGALLLMILSAVRYGLVEPFKIPSSAMEDTLLIGDRFLVNRLEYGWPIPGLTSRLFAFRLPRRGDIVVFVPPHRRDTTFIKRIIGVPGDIVELRMQQVFVNGARLIEPYVVHKDSGHKSAFLPPRDVMQPVTVPVGKYFVLGDNRDRSEDSRDWGFASLEDIKGRATLIYCSEDVLQDEWNPFRRIRWGRILRQIR